MNKTMQAKSRKKFIRISDTGGKVIIPQAEVAFSFWRRFWGLMFKKDIPQGYALVFEKANSLHTFFMRFALDIIYLDKNKRIVKIYYAVKPFRVTISLKACISIEAKSPYLQDKKLTIGTQLVFTPQE